MYRLRPRAKQDIKQIYKTSKQAFGTAQAEKYFREFFKAFRRLEERPELGEEYEVLRQGIRGYLMQSHIIFFQHLRPGEIDVVRVLHKRMDYKRHL